MEYDFQIKSVSFRQLGGTFVLAVFTFSPRYQLLTYFRQEEKREINFLHNQSEQKKFYENEENTEK